VLYGAGGPNDTKGLTAPIPPDAPDEAAGAKK
jgi:hypothetical protein